MDDGPNTGVWVRYRAVGIDSFRPTRGSSAGGTSVPLRGSGFSPSSKVLFGKTTASSVQCVDDSTLVAVSPALSVAGPPGKAFGKLVGVTVRDLGTHAVSALSFRYVR